MRQSKYFWLFLLILGQTLLALYALKQKTLVFASLLTICATIGFFLLVLIDLKFRRKAAPEWFDKQYITYVYILFSYCFLIQAGLTILGENIRLWDNFFLFLYGLFFIMLGNLLPRVPFKSLMGLWLPWIFRSENIWRKVHRLGGILIFFCGIGFMIISMLDLSIPDILLLMLIYLILPMLLINSVCFVYAYVLYRKLN